MNYLHTLISSIDTRPQSADAVQISVPIVLLGLLILGVLATSFFGWVAIGIAKYNGWRLPMRAEKQESAPWGAIDLVFVAMVWFVLQIICATTMRRMGFITPETTSSNASLFVMSMSQLFGILAILVGSIWLVAWFRSKSNLSGWSVRYIFYDVLLGVVGFVLTAPFLWLLMKISTDVTKVDYDHPLMQAIQKEPTNIVPALWVAVIAAPLFEEFGFRVLFQGYLQSLADRSVLPKSLIALLGRGRTEMWVARNTTSSQHERTNSSTQPLTDLGSQSTSRPFEYAEPVSEGKLVSAANESASQETSKPAFWPVLVSGLIFGLAHFSYGMSWVPLVFFGVVLGWLYQKTNRIWPSLVAHMFSNFIGVAGITVQALYGTPTT